MPYRGREPAEEEDWTRIPGPPGYEPARARVAVDALTQAGSPEQASRAVADLRFAVSNDHAGSLYPAAVPAASIFLRIIGTMPGAPREQALAALLDWWGTFHPEPGFDTYHDPAAGLVEIADGITRHVRAAVPMLRSVAGEQFKPQRKAVIELLRCADTGWIPQPLPHEHPGSKAERRHIKSTRPASGPGSR